MNVLIDTWWNVNIRLVTHCAAAFTRFNRYMVECEYYCRRTSRMVIFVLIDTWWNVN